MEYPLRFGIVVWLICSAFLFAQNNPPTEQKQEAPPSVTTPLMKICDQKNPPPCATPPRAVFAPDPQYPEDASGTRYEGTCVVGTIIGTDGRTHDTKVARGLGHGLDEKAIEAVNTWRFEPATNEGKPVAVQVYVKVTYRVEPVIVSPESAHLALGAKQQFVATVPGGTKAAVNWSVGGSGCAASVCGSISADGLYTAPLAVPNPATVTVKRDLGDRPTQHRLAIVYIQPSPSR